MKTTVEIPDSLLLEAREVARAEGTTLRELVEVGLRTALRARARADQFRLRDAVFDGSGLSAEFRGAHPADILDAAYGPAQGPDRGAH